MQRQQREYKVRVEQHEARKQVWQAAALEARSAAALKRLRAKRVAATLERSVPEQIRNLYSREGISEQLFAGVLREHFGDWVRQRVGFEHPSGANERAYAPDFTIYDPGSRLRIDLEIDEPYALITRVATHYLESDPVSGSLIDSDASRNAFFLERGWIVVRFAEEQIVRSSLECAAELARLIARLVPDFAVPPALLGIATLEPVPRWTRSDANRLGELRSRDLYLSALQPGTGERRSRVVTTLPEPSPLQAALLTAMRDSSDHLLVTAVAGSGKTTTLLHALRVASEQKPGGRTLLVAFSKGIKLELESRLTNLGVQSVQVRTLNAFGNGLLREAIGGKDGLKLRAGKYASLLNKYVPQIDQLASLPLGARGRPLNRDALKKHATKLVSFCRAYAAKPGDHTAYSRVAGVLSEEIDPEIALALEEIVHGVLRDGVQQAERFGIIDFDDQCWLPVILDLPIPPYDWLLVDECQDLSSAQLALMMRAVGAQPAQLGQPGSAHGRLLFVGDERQAIMGFRGADSDSIPNIRASLTGALTELPLSVCYRCPPNHLALVRTTVLQIQASVSATNGLIASIDLHDLPNLVSGGDLVLAQKNDLVMQTALILLRAGVTLDYPLPHNRSSAKAVSSDDEENESGSGTPMLIKDLHQTARLLEQQVSAGEGIHLDAVLARAHLGCATALERDRLEFLAIVARHSDGTTLGFRSELELLTRPVKGGVTVCTARKSKGLEASRVFIVKRGDLEPGALKPNDGERARVQLENLRYVALTRAKRELYFVEIPGGR